mmetsp:Transcript_47302/g.110411  ORF Transcript_47302/g.110411 Transcript_47302/m.110411 type:complete len:871 (-) Transcript_47302:174-2786(-)
MSRANPWPLRACGRPGSQDEVDLLSDPSQHGEGVKGAEHVVEAEYTTAEFPLLRQLTREAERRELAGMRCQFLAASALVEALPLLLAASDKKQRRSFGAEALPIAQWAAGRAVAAATRAPRPLTHAVTIPSLPSSSQPAMLGRHASAGGRQQPAGWEAGGGRETADRQPRVTALITFAAHSQPLATLTAGLFWHLLASVGVPLPPNAPRMDKEVPVAYAALHILLRERADLPLLDNLFPLVEQLAMVALVASLCAAPFPPNAEATRAALVRSAVALAACVFSAHRLAEAQLENRATAVLRDLCAAWGAKLQVARETVDKARAGSAAAAYASEGSMRSGRARRDVSTSSTHSIGGRTDSEMAEQTNTSEREKAAQNSFEAQMSALSAAEQCLLPACSLLARCELVDTRIWSAHLADVLEGANVVLVRMRARPSRILLDLYAPSPLLLAFQKLLDPTGRPLAQNVPTFKIGSSVNFQSGGLKRGALQSRGVRSPGAAVVDRQRLLDGGIRPRTPSGGIDGTAFPGLPFAQPPPGLSRTTGLPPGLPSGSLPGLHPGLPPGLSLGPLLSPGLFPDRGHSEGGMGQWVLETAATPVIAASSAPGTVPGAVLGLGVGPGSDADGGEQLSARYGAAMRPGQGAGVGVVFAVGSGPGAGAVAQGVGGQSGVHWDVLAGDGLGAGGQRHGATSNPLTGSTRVAFGRGVLTLARPEVVGGTSLRARPRLNGTSLARPRTASGVGSAEAGGLPRTWTGLDGLQAAAAQQISPWAKPLRVFHSTPDLHCSTGGARVFAPTPSRAAKQADLGVVYELARADSQHFLQHLRQARASERQRRRAVEKDVFGKGTAGTMEALAARIVSKRPGQFIERAGDTFAQM